MAITKNTKTFYHGQIPNDWEVMTLGEMTTLLTNGFVGKAKEHYVETEDGVLYIQGYNISESGFNFNGIKKVSKAFHEKNSKSCLQEGDLLTIQTGEIGLTSIVPKELIGANCHALVISRLKPNIANPNFFVQYFNSEIGKRKFKTIETGSTMKHLNVGDMDSLEFPIPPLPEQKAIAQVLSTADAAIHTTEKLIAQKEIRKKWLMQQLLTGKKRLKGFDGEWKEMHLGDMFIERNETKFFDLPLLSIGQNGVYPQDESVKKDTSNEDKSKYKRICPGDIGYNTMRMWQGRSALSEIEGIVSPAYTVVTPNKNADSIFFSYLFKMPKMTNLFWRNSQGLVDDTLNCKFKDFSIVRVMLPLTKEEQTAIAQVLQAADKEIGLLKAKAEKLREQKKGLMQVLLTGKVRLKIYE